MKTTTAIPADLFDTLDLLSVAELGLCGGQLFSDADRAAPDCLLGGLEFAGAINAGVNASTTALQDALDKVCPALRYDAFDKAHSRLVHRRGTDPYARFPWRTIAREMGVVRGA